MKLTFEQQKNQTGTNSVYLSHLDQENFKECQQQRNEFAIALSRIGEENRKLKMYNMQLTEDLTASILKCNVLLAENKILKNKK